MSEKNRLTGRKPVQRALARLARLLRLFRRQPAGSGPGPRGGNGGGAAGVREPRRPLPRTGAGAAEAPVDDLDPRTS